MAADKAAPKAAEQQDAALRQLLASMRCKQYKKAREACTAALSAGAEPKLMKDYAAVRRGGVRIDGVSTETFSCSFVVPENVACARNDATYTGPRRRHRAARRRRGRRGGRGRGRLRPRPRRRAARRAAADAERRHGRQRRLVAAGAGTQPLLSSASTPSRRRRRVDVSTHRSRRRQSVLPFEPFPYPKFDPAALAGNDESSEEDESESGGEASGA